MTRPRPPRAKNPRPSRAKNSATRPARGPLERRPSGHLERSVTQSKEPRGGGVRDRGGGARDKGLPANGRAKRQQANERAVESPATNRSAGSLPTPSAYQPTGDTVTADKTHTWHPFTQMRDWCAPEHEPLVLVAGDGALLHDDKGRTYIDGNSSIWTNLHGHRHPRIDAAIRDQLERVGHTSFLGFTNPRAAQLARELVAFWPPHTLTRVFFSDDGSTAIEVALKMAAQFWQLSGQPKRTQFVAFTRAYHGDTMGASSLGGIEEFHNRFSTWQFPTTHIEGIDELETLDPTRIAAIVIEPLIQGAAGMRLWPRGMLAALRAWCDRHDALLVADEVMTGFGRTGTMFACAQEDVVPDMLALAKGLTGGYLPLAATLTTERVFSAFLGGTERTFFYGHSYTGNQLACAAALASLAIFREERVLQKLGKSIILLAKLLTPLRALPQVVDVRQCGFIAGIEIKPNAAAVCLAARKHGLLTRSIRNVIVLMPPFCSTPAQLTQAVAAIAQAIEEEAAG